MYSHGNSSDLGSIINLLLEFSRIYSINFLAYDYRGYGVSSGITTEESTYQDLEIVLSVAVNKLNYKLEEIILWGFSLGSFIMNNCYRKLSKRRNCLKIFIIMCYYFRSSFSFCIYLFGK